MESNQLAQKLQHSASCTDPRCAGHHDLQVGQSIITAFKQLANPWSQNAIVSSIGSHQPLAFSESISMVHGLVNGTIATASGLAIARPALRIGIIGDESRLLKNEISSLVHAIEHKQRLAIIALRYRGFEIKKVHPSHLDILSFSLNAGATFLARGFAGMPLHLEKILTAALSHDGLSVVEIIQPCLTLSPQWTYEWYRQHISTLPAITNMDEKEATAQLQAFDPLPIGIFYQKPSVSCQSELLKQFGQPLADMDLNIKLASVLKQYK